MLNKLNIKKNNLPTSFKEYFKIFLSGLIITIGTFPENIWTFDVGIDPSLVWIFNYLFSTDLTNGISIIFPHGPLAFFMYPLPENILLVTIITSALKILLFWSTYELLKTNSNYRFLLSFIIVYFLSLISSFNHLILANILLLNCNFFINRQNILKYLSFILFIFAFYIKSYVAILSGTITVVSMLFFLISEKNYKQFIIDVFILFSGILALWIIMFGSLKGFLIYFYGIINLAQDNSSAASVYRQNNWWFIGGYILFTVCTLVNKEKRSLFFGIIAAFCLFAVWKHGMARQDVHHVNGMTSFIIIIFLIFNIFSEVNRVKNLLLSVLAVFFITYNNQNALNYYQPQFKIIKSNNFIEFISEYNSLKTKSNEISASLISKNILSAEVINIIDKSEVDVYPWDYSIIAANNLNWKPRVVIQSYAAYTSWLDEQNAKYFASDRSAKYIIWHNTDFGDGLNGGTINSIDFRYLLNDEPQSIIELMRCYKTVYSDDKIFLLQKRDCKLNIDSFVSEPSNAQWGQWIEVPDYQENTLQRVKLDFNKTIKQQIKSFLFKDEQFWIFMELNTGEIHKYRIVPKNSVNGLWLNPYSFTFDKSFVVKRIMFIASNQKILTNKINLYWEKIVFTTTPDHFKLFKTDIKDTCQTIYNEINTFERNTSLSSRWSDYNIYNTIEQPYSGNYSYILKPSDFSPSFSFIIDSLPEGQIMISAGCWTYATNYEDTKNIALVISVDYPKGKNVWKGEIFNKQFISIDNWNYIKNYLIVQNTKQGGIIKIYVWNNSNKDINIDDIGVVVRKI